MNEALKMQLSAFVDGELPENESELLLRRLSQDAELRRQVSEYLAVGRVMRGEPMVPGVDTLRDRVAAAIDDGESPAESVETAPAKSPLTRPITGLAVAATVAVAALFGFQQFTTPDSAAGTGDAASVAITQPGPDALLDQYRQSHGDIAEAERGAVAIADRLRNVDVPVSGDGEYVEISADGRSGEADEELDEELDNSEAETASDAAE